VRLDQRKKVAEGVQAPGVTAVTYYRWRPQQRGMTSAQPKRLYD
jgi:hypothetical protein